MAKSSVCARKERRRTGGISKGIIGPGGEFQGSPAYSGKKYTCITLYPDSCKRRLEPGHRRRRKSSPPQCKARCTCSACARRTCMKPAVGQLINLPFMPLPSSFSFPL